MFVLFPDDVQVYLVNCLAACHGVLVVRPVAGAWAQRVADTINRCVGVYQRGFVEGAADFTGNTLYWYGRCKPCMT